MDKENKQSNKSKKKRLLLYILSGGILSEDFVVKHTGSIVLTMILVFIFIGNRYTCVRQLRDIDRLQSELEDVRFENLSISIELTGEKRQSKIEKLIKKQDLRLESPHTPSYIIKK